MKWAVFELRRKRWVKVSRWIMDGELVFDKASARAKETRNITQVRDHEGNVVVEWDLQRGQDD